METSFGVDEAEQMLSDLVNKGHLLVESEGGALTYMLPGGRFIAIAQA